MKDLSIGRKKVLATFADFIATEDGTYGLPVDVVKIAKDNGITYSLNDYQKYFDGMLEHESGSFHIFINNHGKLNMNTPRLRFSFAHELGHYFIDEHRTMLEAGNSLYCPSFYKMHQKQIIEKEADYFASNLLMPESKFGPLCKGVFSYELVERLQRIFNTSLSATLFRYMELGEIPIMVVCVVGGIIKYEWCSKDFSYPYIKKDYTRKVPLLTCAGDYFENNVKCEDTESVEAKAWFCSYDDLSDIMINEKCIYQENYNTTYSILWE